MDIIIKMAYAPYVILHVLNVIIRPPVNNVPNHNTFLKLEYALVIVPLRVLIKLPGGV